jgi:hypothetical protein
MAEIACMKMNGIIKEERGREPKSKANLDGDK